MLVRKRRGLAVAIGALAGVLALAGCTATDASAVRVNSDGSLDYVICASEALTASSEGVVVHFAPPAQEWNSLIIGTSVFSSVKIHFESYTPDEWHWNTDEWFHTRTRCFIKE